MILVQCTSYDNNTQVRLCMILCDIAKTWVNANILDGRIKPENVQQNLFDGIFCYKLPTDIFIEHLISHMH